MGRTLLLVIAVFLAGGLAGMLATLGGLGELAVFGIVLAVAVVGFLVLVR